jgi:hypothetical protein
MQTAQDLIPSRRTSMAPLGYALGGLSLLAFIALLHHPVGHGREPADILASIRSQTTMDQLVHATLALIFGVLATVMFLFASCLGLRRFTVASGLVAFSCAVVFLLLAAMTDGFVIPAIAAQCAPDPSSSCIAEALTLLRMSAVQIEYLTRFSLAAVAISAAAWSVALLSTKGIPRWAGFVGLASGVCQLGALQVASSRLRLDSLLAIFALQLVWYLLAASLMILRCGPFADGPHATAA